MKQTILEILEASQPNSISGETIAGMLHMTRANVWKEVQKLKERGFHIESVRNQGYRLISHNNKISEAYIQSNVTETILEGIEYKPTTGSTNTDALKLAQTTNANNTLIIADEQTQGKGRMGRTFHSPSQHGIYMSLILRPNLPLESVQLVTLAGALAVIRAIKECFNIDTQVKWLNDIYYKSHKLCGILTEGELILESLTYRSLVLGIGLNTTTDPNLPKEIRDIYGALENLTHQNMNRNKLIASILNHFYALYNAFPDNQEALVEAYKLSSNTIGKTITIRGEDDTPYLAYDISREGHLMVKNKDGVIRSLNSGEVSIQGAQQ